LIEICISKDTLVGMALFAAPMSKRLDPRCAVHILHVDEFSLRLAATNGREIAMLRLLKEGDQLKNFYWDPEEDLIASVPLGLAFGLEDMGKFIILHFGHSYVELKPYMGEGENGIERGVRVPRVRAIQRNLFTDFQEIPPVSRGELLGRPQLVVKSKVLSMFAKAAKKLGITAPEEMSLAQLDGAYGITFGSFADFWGLTPCDTLTASALAGLPPDWVTGTAPAEEVGTSFTERIANLIGAEEEEEGEQGAMQFGDADALAEAEDETADEAEESDATPPDAPPSTASVNVHTPESHQGEIWVRVTIPGQDYINLPIGDFAQLHNLPGLLKRIDYSDLQQVRQAAEIDGQTTLCEMIDLEFRTRGVVERALAATG
jgi:hypothetical protein